MGYSRWSRRKRTLAFDVAFFAFLTAHVAYAGSRFVPLWVGLAVPAVYAAYKLRKFLRVDKPTGAVPTLTHYAECRSWHGTAVHIRDLRSDGTALCSYDPLDTGRPLDAESYRKLEPMQHEGWHYCSSCSVKFKELHGMAVA